MAREVPSPREYLQEKLALGGREWLRRDPRVTHPDILGAVRRAQASGLFYDLDVLEFATEDLGIPKGPLVAQLAHEVYIAKGCLRDEDARIRMAAALSEGFVRLEDAVVEEGGRYTGSVWDVVRRSRGPGFLRASVLPCASFGWPLGLAAEGCEVSWFSA